MDVAENTVRTLAPFVASPLTTAVILDLDGTLAPIVPHPEDVAIPQRIRHALEDVVARYGLAAVVSGRQIDQLRSIVGLDGIAYSGNHGYEIQTRNGRELPVASDQELAHLRAFVSDLQASRLAEWDVWLEDKGATVTFHYREARDPELARSVLQAEIAPMADAAGLDVEPGRMSLEVHPNRTTTKGTAVTAILREHPELDRVVSLGDDRTDVEVWRAIHGLRAGGALRHAVGIAITSDESPAILLEHADLAVEGIGGTELVLATLLGAQTD